jgi:hypothetical protein
LYYPSYSKYIPVLSATLSSNESQPLDQSTPALLLLAT